MNQLLPTAPRGFVHAHWGFYFYRPLGVRRLDLAQFDMWSWGAGDGIAADNAIYWTSGCSSWPTSSLIYKNRNKWLMTVKKTSGKNIWLAEKYSIWHVQILLVSGFRPSCEAAAELQVIQGLCIWLSAIQVMVFKKKVLVLRLLVRELRCVYL